MDERDERDRRVRLSPIDQGYSFLGREDDRLGADLS